MLKLFGFGVVAVLQSVLPSVLFADPDSVTLPLQAVAIDAAGNNKVGITVSVAGGPPSLVTFDTGGAGLHIMQSQVPNVQPGPNSQYTSIGFGSGVIYSGYIATLPVTIDQPDGTGVATTAPMPIMIVQKITCSDGSNNCGIPASGQPQYGYFWGEFGAGMNPEILQIQNSSGTEATLCSPIRYLSGNLNTGYLIENLTPSDDANGAQGQLVIGLPSGQIPGGFIRIFLPQEPNNSCPGLTGPVYDDRNTQLTYQIGTYPAEKLVTVFDTGGGSNINGSFANL